MVLSSPDALPCGCAWADSPVTAVAEGVSELTESMTGSSDSCISSCCCWGGASSAVISAAGGVSTAAIELPGATGIGPT